MDVFLKMPRATAAIPNAPTGPTYNIQSSQWRECEGYLYTYSIQREP